ncbi:MAG: cytochrome b, partial [Rhodospirillaceae bacterium]|nr:cytochrome b [Rhodospirillaceae bacterium]
LARTVHWLLLLGALAMPIAGIAHALGEGREISVFGLFSFGRIAPDEALAEWAGAVHENAAFALIALIALHLVGALKHHWIDRDGTLTRMLGR